MRAIYEERVAEQRTIERAIVQGTAQLCSPLFGRVCKAIWPHNTDAHLAAAARIAIRTAGYEISGEREPSVHSLVAVISAITSCIQRKGKRARE